MAQRELARQGGYVTIGATTLLHEAYLDISGREGIVFPDRARFMSYAARVMRGLIIDHARRRHAMKRGGMFEIASTATVSIAPPTNTTSSASAMRSTSSRPWTRRLQKSSTSNSSAGFRSPISVRCAVYRSARSSEIGRRRGSTCIARWTTRRRNVDAGRRESRVTLVRFSGDNGAARLIQKVDVTGNLLEIYTANDEFKLKIYGA